MDAHELKERIVETDDPGFPVAWQATLEGYTAQICYEQYDVEFANPRDFDNLGTMICWHPDYALGDEQLKDGGGRGHVKTIFETERGRTDFRDMRVVERYLKLARGAVVTIPLYLYDHSGISMSAGAPNPFDNPTVKRDHHGSGLGWDTTMIGYIYTTRERIVELCGEGKDGEIYCPSDWNGTPLAWIVKQLQSEVRQYDSYLRGDVVYTRVTDPNGEDTDDGCGGYLPDHDERGDGFEYLRNDLREALVLNVLGKRESDAAEAVERERAARMDIATVSA